MNQRPRLFKIKESIVEKPSAREVLFVVKLIAGKLVNRKDSIDWSVRSILLFCSVQKYRIILWSSFDQSEIYRRPCYKSHKS